MFVIEDKAPGRFIDFYTLSAMAFRKDGLPQQQAKKLPHYPVPAATISRLAVDLSRQGQGYGESLLFDAFRRIVLVSESMGFHAVVVDALNSGAANFYRNFSFLSFQSPPNRLYLPLATILKLDL